ACRSCLHPVCMIPCPVASIRRGSNREIVIEDWCIGCSACAESCPYGSIQMDDLGVIPGNARGWRWLPALSPLAQGEWFRPRFNDRRWPQAVAPFRWEREVQEAILKLTPPTAQGTPVWERLVNFRFEFELSRGDVAPAKRYKFEVMAKGSVVDLW